jgi:hypothetical protein
VRSAAHRAARRDPVLDRLVGDERTDGKDVARADTARLTGGPDAAGAARWFRQVVPDEGSAPQHVGARLPLRESLIAADDSRAAPIDSGGRRA